MTRYDIIGAAYNYLDALDAFLIAAIQEVEEIRHRELAPDQMETELTAIWRRTYACAASHEEGRLARVFLTRGCAIRTLYPDSVQRRRMYKTSLSPRSATSLLAIVGDARAKFQKGNDYARFSTEGRFIFIREILSILDRVPTFRIGTKLGRTNNFKDWPKLLRWWLSKATLPAQPAPKEITSWYDFVAQNFVYRGAWGLGSIIGLLMDESGDGEPIRALEIGDWPRTGLPWIAFWIKELLIWGTLDPIVAFLLARGNAFDRPQAEAEARGYYDTLQDETDANEILDPRRIQKWVNERSSRPEVPQTERAFVIEAELARPAAEYLGLRLAVSPLDIDNNLIWIDSAGYTVAHSAKPLGWPSRPSTFDFELDVAQARIAGDAYLRHTSAR